MMTHRRQTIALDFRTLDQLNMGSGQYRYCINLINGLAKLLADCAFIVIGSRPEPPAPISHVFTNQRWRYRCLQRWNLKGGFYLDDLRAAWLFREERVDLLHSLHTLVPLLSSVRSVITIHDMMPELFPEYREMVASRPYRRFRYYVQTQSRRLIAISRTTADDVQRLWGVPKAKISVVYHGVELASPRTATLAAARFAAHPFLLSPYNLEPRKNLISLLRAMVAVRRVDANLRLVLYGRAAVTPEREERFHADVRALGLQQTVVLTDFVAEDELAFLYRRARLFVFPSLYEGFGFPVLEAMAAGVCTVARNQSAMAEVLADAGVQTETKDPEALATTICSLLVDPARRAALGQAARMRSSRFTVETMARRTLAAYMHALDGEVHEPRVAGESENEQSREFDAGRS